MNEKLDACKKFVKGLPVIGDLLDKKPRVVVIRLAGVIADTHIKKQGINHARFTKIIDKAFDRPNLKAVALLINSPGGAAAQSSLIATQIRRLADEKELPVYAFIEDVAASGGYWLACAADEIYAQETSIVGSIGVISASFGFEDFIEKHGIHRRLYTSGANKSFLDPFSPEKQEDLKRLNKIQKDLHGTFKDWVSARRAEKLNGTDKELFEGAFWTGMPALEKGIIDGIGDLQTILREKYGEDFKTTDLTPERKFGLPLPLLGKLENPFTQTSLSDDILETIESRALWSRFGL